MPSTSLHRIIAADAHAVPPPFRAFAVRSDEAGHAADARAPYGRVHAIRTDFLDAASLASLAAEGRARVGRVEFWDVDYAATTLEDLAAAAPGVRDLVGQIAGALQASRVFGDDPAAYRDSVGARIDYLVTCGAGFHNDVGRHWSRCLFWILALDVGAAGDQGDPGDPAVAGALAVADAVGAARDCGDVEFVMPHAGVRLSLAPGALLVFDQTMAHGLCRSADGGQAVAASFDADACRGQVFLTGELLLTDGQWEALGAPWLPVEEHERRGALDLMVAEFDERTGAIKRLRAMADCMKRSTCHVDGPAR